LDAQGSIGDQFGATVGISDDGARVVVGIPGREYSFEKARVFEFQSQSWQPVGSDILSDNSFATGVAVAISGNGERIAVASMKSGSTGGVFVYDEPPTVGGDGQWQIVGSRIPNRYSGWGRSTVAISQDGTRVVAGSVPVDSAIAADAVARVYDEPSSGGNAWNLVAEETTGLFVAISSDGSRIAVGSHLETPETESDVRVRSVESWDVVGEIVDGFRHRFFAGTPVAISGDGSRVAVASASKVVNGNLVPPGNVRVFGAQDGGGWVQVGQSIDFDTRTEVVNVALSENGNRLLLGVSYNGSTGYSQVYSLALPPAPVPSGGGPRRLPQRLPERLPMSSAAVAVVGGLVVGSVAAVAVLLAL
jgi:hypothetical protein